MNSQNNTPWSPLVDTYPQYPFEIESGSGVNVTDTEGNTYLDLYGGHAVCALGHSHPSLTAALSEQAKKLFFYSNLTKLSVRTRAAEQLLSFADSHLESVFFCNSGAEANENALRISLQLTGRSELVALRGGFHGRTTMAAAVTDNSEWHEKFPEWSKNVLHIEPNSLSDLPQITNKAACVIVEPIQSIGGVTVLEKDYLKALRERCDEVGALLIFDEIQTGIGRTGIPFVNHHIGVDADITTSAKSLGGGFPVGAVLMSGEIAKEIKLGDLGSTFGGSPLAAACISATLSVIQQEALMPQAFELGQYVRESLSSLKSVKSIRGAGCLLGIQLTSPAKEVVAELRNRNILTGTSGVSDVMRLLPPLITTTESIDRLHEALEEIES